MADGAAEGSLVGGRVVQCGHDLDVDAMGEREDEVARPEGRVDPSIDERRAEVRSDPLHDLGELAGGAGVGDVVQAHGGILAIPPTAADTHPREAGEVAVRTG